MSDPFPLNLDFNEVDFSPPVIWRLSEGVEIARLLEPIAINNGWHVTLGGSVLVKGEASKDLDIFFYQHTTSKSKQPIPVKEIHELVADIENKGLGFSIEFNYTDKASASEGVYKQVITMSYKGKRVDFIFLSPT